jgi:hypothetical protein
LQAFVLISIGLGACAPRQPDVVPAKAPPPVTKPAPLTEEEPTAPDVPDWVRRELSALGLPRAEHTLELVAGAAHVMITKTDVIVEGERVARVDAVLAEGRLTRVDAVFDRLKALRETWKRDHPGEPFPGVVQFWVDGSTPALVVKSVFQTAAYAGYPNGAFVVRRRDDPKQFARMNADAIVPRPPTLPESDAAPGGSTQVSGRLPPEVIQRIVRQGFGPMRKCYERGLTKNAKLEGLVKVRFVIGRDGAVAEVAVHESTLPDTKVVECVVKAFWKLSFPQPEGGIVVVMYPVQFSPN